MTIEQVTTYRFDGRDFQDLKAVRTHIENEIGRIIDSTQPLRLTPQQALAVLDAITKNHKRLTYLLGAEYETDDETKNILESDV